MLRSRVVAKENPSISCNTVLVFGIGKGFLTNLFITSQKSLIKRMILSFLGIMKDGETHSDAGCLSNTPSLHNLSTSFMMVFLWIFKLGHGRVILPPLIGMRPAWSFSHLRCRQRATYISQVAAVTSFADWCLDACNCL
jgi:hypothetical protein